MKILFPFAWIYGSVMAVRNWLFDHGYLSQQSFNLPVISVGNLSVGGTGKTPHTEYLLRLLSHTGKRCATLSRGYGRNTHGYYEAKGNGPSEVGDEPWQIQTKFPNIRVCVCEKRVEGINQMLKANAPEIILLDDAFQHRYVKPGLSVMLTEYSRPYFADYVIPAGRLREFRGGAKRADIIIVTKCPETVSSSKIEDFKKCIAPLPHQRVFFTRFAYGKIYAFAMSENKERIVQTEDLKQSHILLLCGIARPKNLIDYLQSKCHTLDVASFPDHHNFTEKEIQELGNRAKRYDKVITTEKDAARLTAYHLPTALKQRLLVQPIEVEFLNNDTQKFNKIIIDYVTKN